MYEMYGLNCLQCNYFVISFNIYEILKKALLHFIKSHSHTHVAFTISASNLDLKFIRKFYEEYELPHRIFVKIKSRKAPYTEYIDDTYHRKRKHIIYILGKIK